ncbi:MAG TPA: MarR family transcriptional regulator [Candidatus Dormibacteraeota bacterium]|jgi:DNA-binding MarR family transcriptional regulator|nr:MarR family transcriptional regulator [Candidatus Dormibacteraeota bacterium]
MRPAATCCVPREDHVARVRAQWAREAPGLDTGPMAVVARVGRAHAYMDHALEETFARHGLTRGTWDVLVALRRQGPPYRLSPTELYRQLMRTSGAMTHRLARLERAELIRRIPDPDDGRGLLVALTRRGRTLVDAVGPVHMANERALLQALSTEEQEQLAGLLGKLLCALEHEQPARVTVRGAE